MLPRTILAADIAVLAPTPDRSEWQILLIERGHPPFEGMLALPGGLVENDEAPVTAAWRELEEETNLTLTAEDLTPVNIFGNPGRDPRGRCVSMLYLAVLPEIPDVAAGDDARATRWLPLSETPLQQYAFDHDELLREIRNVAPATLTPVIRAATDADGHALATFLGLADRPAVATIAALGPVIVGAKLPGASPVVHERWPEVAAWLV